MAALATVRVHGEDLPPLGFGEYDVLICGTGLTECVLAGLLATHAARGGDGEEVGGDASSSSSSSPSASTGLRVLMIDRNEFYGGASASLDLRALFDKFEGAARGGPTPAEIAGFTKGAGDVHAFRCDLTPKFIMAGGTLARILQRTGATRYLDLYQVDGSFAAKSGGAKLHKVPATSAEAVQSSLVGFFQKRRLRAVLKFAMECDLGDAAAPAGKEEGGGAGSAERQRLCTTTARQFLMDEHWCDESTCEFIGHCIALYTDDAYLDGPALPLVENLRLYATSLLTYQDSSSPFLYPEYGLGGMPEAFARLCSIHGGDFMLGRDVSELVFERAGEGEGKDGSGGGDDLGGGRVCAVKSWNVEQQRMEAATIRTVIGDPSYFADARWRVQQGRVIRCICLLSGPVPGLEKRKNARGEKIESAQIIIPKSQCEPKRMHDIYVSVVGHAMQCTPEGVYCATISTMMESSATDGGAAAAIEAAALSELEAALRVVGGADNILRKFVEITPFYMPARNDGEKTGVFVSRSCDATTHFESTTRDILDLYKKVTGQSLDLREE